MTARFDGHLFAFIVKRHCDHMVKQDIAVVNVGRRKCKVTGKDSRLLGVGLNRGRAL